MVHPLCGHEPVFEELASNYPDALFLTVDVDEVKVSPLCFMEMSLETFVVGLIFLESSLLERNQRGKRVWRWVFAYALVN